MRKPRTAYELGRSQVDTPKAIVHVFWKIVHKYRSRFSRVLDLGAGDGRFAVGGRFSSYEGIEIDDSRNPSNKLPNHAKIVYSCAFEHEGGDYAACIGNPPYVRHHDLNVHWRNVVAKRLKKETGVEINRKCNLYIYFLFLALLKSRRDGIVSTLVPYEWVSRPSAKPLRDYIKRNHWHVDVYRFSESVFNKVMTTSSISIIDKKNKDNQWQYFSLSPTGNTLEFGQITGSNKKVLSYENRGKLWAMRGMSPGTQKVFTLTEGERMHAGLSIEDVLPCVTSLREVPKDMSHLTKAAFRKRFVETGAKCWLIKSHVGSISPRLQAYIENISEKDRDTWTCNSREPWYRYVLSDAPRLLVSTGFRTFGPKVLINSVGAYAVGSVCGVYSEKHIVWSSLRKNLIRINFEDRIVPHSNNLKKIEIRQLNGVLNRYLRMEKCHA
jgi:hypothetical protein